MNTQKWRNINSGITSWITSGITSGILLQEILQAGGDKQKRFCKENKEKKRRPWYRILPISLPIFWNTKCGYAAGVYKSDPIWGNE